MFDQARAIRSNAFRAERKEAFDMNADGKADIQWQNDNDAPAVWLMDGATMTSAAILSNPTADWHLI